jgi:hypothetical protein
VYRPDVYNQISKKKSNWLDIQRDMHSFDVITGVEENTHITMTAAFLVFSYSFFSLIG